MSDTEEPTVASGTGDLPSCEPSYVMPEWHDVVMRGETDEEVILRVHVTKATAPKKYLGGYRHKTTGVTYHHASSQTVERSLIPPRRNVECLRHRDTQTYDTKSRSNQSFREFGTQMKREDLHISESQDRKIPCRPYFTASQLLELKKKNALVIQCHWRGYVARRRSLGIRQRLYERHLAEENVAQAAAARDALRQKHEVNRRVNPRSRKDFELIYNELGAWRVKEVARIYQQEGATVEEKKESLKGVLTQETKTLQTIDRLKDKAAKDGRCKRIEDIINQMARPKRWEVGNGEIQEVHTPFTTRAAELRDLYMGLTNPSPPDSSRLQMLLNLKWTVQEFSCPLTRDIAELCDREADLLSRGRPEHSLNGLRRRLSNLFLQFIETSEFNPEAARFLKVPTFRQSNTSEVH